MKITYRPEIDGLRAIAVSAVILYHSQIIILGQRPFKGGFIGVDIFFVISGYLITSLILKELITTGSFSFKNFYERRVRRILPALLVVILASLPFSWMYLLPNSFLDFSKSVLYSLGFGSNFYFHFSGQQYGADSGLLKPFLHTWSLSVEEQFYIIFPIILLIVFKFFNKYLIHIFIFGFIISLGVADWSSKNSLSVSFYFIHTRMWELLAGSILAYFEIKQGHRSQNKLLNLIMPSIGLFLIILTIVFFKLHFPHPSLHSLPAILGVCLIIWFSNSNEPVTKLLSTKIFVGVGLISYSLYLWHYPIFAFVRINEIGEGNLPLILLLVIITILSILTYYLIEQPTRNKKFNFKLLSSSIVISFLISIMFSLNVLDKAGYKNRLPEILAKNLEQDIFKRNIFEESWRFWHLLKNENGEHCFNNTSRCSFNKSSTQKIYLIGDSHAGSIMYDLKKKIIDKNYQFITSVVGACSFYPGFNMIIPKTGKIDDKCTDEYFQNLKKILSKEKDSIIIFVARFPAHLTNLEFSQNLNDKKVKWHRDYVSVGKYKDLQTSFRNEVLDLSKNNKIILMYPIPEVDYDPNKKIYLKWINRENKFSKDLNFEYLTTSYKAYQTRTKSSFELLDSIKSDNVYRVYPHKLFCNTTFKDKCMTHNDKIVFYIDSHHPSLKGSHLINELIIKEIEKIELAF
jgi:peptidoglycan/LPS O-acetylase OafA/YrhL